MFALRLGVTSVTHWWASHQFHPHGLLFHGRHWGRPLRYLPATTPRHIREVEISGGVGAGIGLAKPNRIVYKLTRRTGADIPGP